MQLFTFWSFSPFTYVERLCLTSMLAAGHPVDLYTYDRDIEAPPGVKVRHAEDIMPRDRVFFHPTKKSPAPFADILRCEGLKRGLGTWVDADILMLRSIADMGEYILGRQADGSVNNAVLRLPARHPYFDCVNKLTTARVPLLPYWSFTKKARQIIRAFTGRQRRLGQLAWTAFGPSTLTYFADHDPLLQLVQPPQVFYPIDWRESVILFDPEVRVEERFVSATRTVHLWNNSIRELKKLPPPRGSFIERMCRQHGVVPCAEEVSRY